LPSFLLFACVGKRVYNLSIMLTSTEITNKGGRPIDMEAVRLVKQLRNIKGNSFREIQAIVAKRLKKPVDIKTVYRWYHYKLVVDK